MIINACQFVYIPNIIWLDLRRVQLSGTHKFEGVYFKMSENLVTEYLLSSVSVLLAMFQYEALSAYMSSYLRQMN